MVVPRMGLGAPTCSLLRLAASGLMCIVLFLFFGSHMMVLRGYDSRLCTQELYLLVCQEL